MVDYVQEMTAQKSYLKSYYEYFEYLLLMLYLMVLYAKQAYVNMFMCLYPSMYVFHSYLHYKLCLCVCIQACIYLAIGYRK